MSTAYYKMAGISPYKARRVADLIRGLDVEDAEDLLENMSTPIAHAFLKLLRSAVANARHNDSLNTDELRLARVQVDKGPVFKRFRAKSRGRAGSFNRPTSHIRLEVLQPEEGE